MQTTPNVRLISHTPDPEKVIATAAKLCYSSSDVEHLMEGLTDEKVKSFLELLFNLGHESPIEHATFTFAIEGISRACSHQLVRHRIASYSQKSQRYVNEGGFDYIVPPSIERHAYLKTMFETEMNHIQNKYDYLRACLATEIMNDEGISKEAAAKRANEDARFLLPNACETKIVVTMNIRSLFNFFKERCCNRAQWEIREMAMQMWHLCMEVSPLIFQHAGPECITKGKCPEGKMSCGKPPIMCHGERSHPSPDKLNTLENKNYE
jgi:thymidylate synthase (FAD)